MSKAAMDPKVLERLVKALRGSPLLGKVPEDALRSFASQAQIKRFKDKQTIVTQGEASDSFFVILQGQAAVTVEHEATNIHAEVARLGTMDCFGEMGLLLEKPRTATVTAVDAVVAARFAAKAFAGTFMHVPMFGLAVSQALAGRLDEMSRSVPLPIHDLDKDPPQESAHGILPMDFIQRHRVLPISLHGCHVIVGFVEDVKKELIDRIREMVTGLQVRPVRIDAAAFDQLLGSRAFAEGWGRGEMTTQQGMAMPDSGKHNPKLDALLNRMVSEGASDLHLCAGLRPRWRLDGDLPALTDAPIMGPTDVMELLEPVMEERHIETFNEKKDVDFAYAIPDLARFRVNMFQDARGTGAVLRRVPNKILSMEQLGLPHFLKDLCEHPKGLVLVTGPTGSGKSTTLAAMVDYINRTFSRHIITLEDPIEFVHDSRLALVNQREIGSHTESFSSALRAALREDPDIVLVGEMRDLETVSLALEVANTGHLVFGTLHTSTAISTVDRIIELFPADEQHQVRGTLAAVLRGVVSQCLCKKIGGGRVAALEVLIVNAAIANLVREGKAHQMTNLMLTGRKQGNTLLNVELARLVNEDIIEYDEALSKAVDKADLMKRMERG